MNSIISFVGLFYLIERKKITIYLSYFQTGHAFNINSSSCPGQSQRIFQKTSKHLYILPILKGVFNALGMTVNNIPVDVL